MDLRTTYMGLELQHPIVPSASPLSSTIDGIKRLEDGGAAAVVMFSLFEEQLRHENDALEHLVAAGAESYAESLSYFPALDEYHVGPDRYLELLRRAADETDIPVIASLNGVTSEGWVDIARMMQEAGASGLELNIYYIPADIGLDSTEVEHGYLQVLRAVRAAVSIPIALKISPFFSSIGHMARRLDEAGADALVLFNRFYQPDFDLDRMEVTPNLELSQPSEIRLPLLWIATLYGRLNASLAATRGVEDVNQVAKYLAAGADVVMTASALLRHGPGHLGSLVQGLRDWMALKGYKSLDQVRGIMSRQRVDDPSAFERANYIRVLESYKSDYVP
jgi:dihydroorotate dehydrogenase (fumarate)